MSRFPFTVKSDLGETDSPKISAYVTVEMKDGVRAVDVLNYLRSAEAKNDFFTTWMAKNAPGFGVEVRGGPHPIFENPKDRASRVVAYEQEFRLCRSY